MNLRGKPKLDEYFCALDRLREGTSLTVKMGTRITNDAVSLEAGRQKGSIKKSRPQFQKLIAAIDLAAAEQTAPNRGGADRMDKAKETAAALRTALDAAMGRELSLLAELYEARRELAALTGEKVLPIRRQR